MKHIARSWDNIVIAVAVTATIAIIIIPVLILIVANKLWSCGRFCLSDSVKSLGAVDEGGISDERMW